jgi:hypothetical protein
MMKMAVRQPPRGRANVAIAILGCLTDSVSFPISAALFSSSSILFSKEK